MKEPTFNPTKEEAEAWREFWSEVSELSLSFFASGPQERVVERGSMIAHHLIEQAARYAAMGAKLDGREPSIDRFLSLVDEKSRATFKELEER